MSMKQISSGSTNSSSLTSLSFSELIRQKKTTTAAYHVTEKPKNTTSTTIRLYKGRTFTVTKH